MMQPSCLRSGAEESQQKQGNTFARMVLFLGLGICAMAAPAVLLTPSASGQNLAATQKVIEGKVFSANDSLQPGAVVYLKDMKSLEIKTYISGQDGVYRFGQLGTQDDYQLWAEYGGHKSKVKNISSFDSKKLFQVSLHIEDK